MSVPALAERLPKFEALKIRRLTRSDQAWIWTDTTGRARNLETIGSVSIIFAGIISGFEFESDDAIR